jgi:hypothetical protein
MKHEFKNIPGAEPAILTGDAIADFFTNNIINDSDATLSAVINNGTLTIMYDDVDLGGEDIEIPIDTAKAHLYNGEISILSGADEECVGSYSVYVLHQQFPKTYAGVFVVTNNGDSAFYLEGKQAIAADCDSIFNDMPMDVADNLLETLPIHIEFVLYSPKKANADDWNWDDVWADINDKGKGVIERKPYPSLLVRLKEDFEQSFKMLNTCDLSLWAHDDALTFFQNAFTNGMCVNFAQAAKPHLPKWEEYVVHFGDDEYDYREHSMLKHPEQDVYFDVHGYGSLQDILARFDATASPYVWCGDSEGVSNYVVDDHVMREVVNYFVNLHEKNAVI